MIIKPTNTSNNKLRQNCIYHVINYLKKSCVCKLGSQLNIN